ncbi:hypothetical protein [Enterocloster bolteae]|uniref:hypothetical protein n=1 Tax=Enterocloster bolteae TaxID=208479 RepID=UPI0028DBABFD|nr:hypothetical protein [Enterocloster bolteae]
MLVKIVFGGCVLLAAVWLLISLAIRRRGNYPIAAFVLDIVITLLVLVMFGFSIFGFVREQNRQRRWQETEQNIVQETEQNIVQETEQDIEQETGQETEQDARRDIELEKQQELYQETEIFSPEESWISETKTHGKVNVSETTETQIPISTPSSPGKGAAVKISRPTTEETQNN